MYYLAPSELDYKAKKCKRCFYIYKKDKISSGVSLHQYFQVLTFVRQIILNLKIVVT